MSNLVYFYDVNDFVWEDFLNYINLSIQEVQPVRVQPTQQININTFQNVQKVQPIQKDVSELDVLNLQLKRLTILNVFCKKNFFVIYTKI